MEKDDEFLHTYFTYLSQLCFEKSKEHVEKEKELCRNTQGPWLSLLTQLMQIVLAEKSYIDLGFLMNKNKSFLRKDNSLRAVFETLKNDLKKVEENCKQSVQDRHIANYCQNIFQYISARIHLIDFYEKICLCGTNKCLKYNEILVHIENVIQRHVLSFTDISMTPIKAIFSLECEILEGLFKAMIELQRLQFLPSLALIYGAHTRLSAWENKMQNRETWKLGFLKNNPLPALFQWLVRFKGAVLSKFSLYFHETLSKQTATSEMRQLCSKLQHDYYHKMVAFQRKYDAVMVFLLSDNQINCDTTEYDSYPVIISFPRNPVQFELLSKLQFENSIELSNFDKIIYKFCPQDQCTYILNTVEPNIYLYIIFESKKSEKDTYIANFIQDFCTTLRCVKIFTSLKNQSK